MLNRNWLALPCLCLALAIGVSFAKIQSSQAKQQQSQTKEQAQAAPLPDINGEWTGTWGSYNPSQGTTPPKDICKKLDCKVEYKDGVWNAIFEGDCGRPYKYTIKMEGRQVGKVVMFKGTTDLGAKDGGVFDWIGRANEKEFVGFFTSGYYTGTFSLTKKQPQ
jgi:hypothetical protein